MSLLKSPQNPSKASLIFKSGFEMLISGFIKLLTLVMSQVTTTQVMSSLLSEAALHSTSQQPLHKPLGCCFSRFMATKSPYCSIPGSASHPCGSSPQSIHVCIHTQRSQCSLPKELPWLQAQPCDGQAGVSLAQPSQGSAWQ